MKREDIDKIENTENETINVFEQILEKINSLEFTFRGDVKRKFLTNVWKKSKENNTSKTISLYISVVAGIIEEEERKNKKEWMNFIEDQVDDAFINMDATSIITLQSYLTIIKDYLAATTPDGDILLRGFDYTINLTKQDMIRNGYIDNYGEREQFLTEKELDDIVLNGYGDCNAKIIAILLFNGVKGEKFSDIGNIRDVDVDINNKVIYKQNGEVLCEIDDKYLHLFEELLHKEHYHVYDANGKIKKTAEYAHPVSENKVEGLPFLKRTKYRNNNSLEPIDQPIIGKRIAELGESVKNYYINPTSIYNSGLVYKLLKENDFNEVSFSDLEKFREEENVKLSFANMKRITRVLLDKIREEESPQ